MRRRCRYQHADVRHFSGLPGERSTRRDEQAGRQNTDHIAPSHIASRACGLRIVDTTKAQLTEHAVFGDAEMTFRISAVAACCSAASASARLRSSFWMGLAIGTAVTGKVAPQA